MTPHFIKHVARISLALCVALQVNLASAAGPLKVFILAGQSNMQGHARTTTLDYLGKDEATAPLLAEILDADGQPRVSDRVWISYLSQNRDGSPYVKHGPLTVGYGADPGKLGPELTFGLAMQKHIDEPILLIKTAWGGKSLHTDFRPPGAGPYVFNPTQLEKFKTQGKDLAQMQAEKDTQSGHYYRLMIEHVNHVLADPKKYHPDYDPSQGYEIAGFVWFQGWNDAVDRDNYPERDQPGGYDVYSTLLAQFIRDVRKDLKAPRMPFVIGVMGVGGPVDLNHPNRYTASTQNFRDAMATPASLPEFEGSVVAVRTEHFWDPLQGSADEKKGQVRAEIDKLKKDGRTFEKGEESALFDQKLAEALTPQEMEAYKGISHQGYHYLGSAKILGRIGKAFADAMAPMVK